MSDEPTFESFIEKERTRLSKHRADIEAKRSEIDQQLAKIDKELEAIKAYEAVKTGKAVAPVTRTPRAAGSKRRTGIRDEVLAVIAQHPQGIGRADILEAMGAKGEKKEEQAISNALSALKKADTVTAEDGKYSVPS